MRTLIVATGCAMLLAIAVLADDAPKADSVKAEAALKADQMKAEAVQKTEQIKAEATGDSTTKMDAGKAAAAKKGGDLVTTKSGLKYTDEVVGTGVEATAGKSVDVHYTGWLDESGKKGKKFDSSVDRGQPFSFRLGAGQVIKGWDEGVAGMKVGGKRTLIIPAALGYGPNGYPPVIPGNSTLIFDVELLKVK